MTTSHEVIPSEAERSPARPRRLVAALLVVHVGLIAGLPFVTGRRLDTAVGRFPDASSVFWLLALPAALSLIAMVVALSLKERASWRRISGRGVAGAAMSNRLTAVVAVVTVVALAGAIRGVGDAGFGLSAMVLITVLLVAIVEEFVLRTLGADALALKGWSERHVAVVTSALFIPVSLAHVVTEGATTFPVVIVTAACGPALYMLTHSTGSSAVPIVVRTLVVFGLSVGRFGPDPQQHVEFLVGMVVVALAAGLGVFGVFRVSAVTVTEDAPVARSFWRSAAFISAVVLGPIVALMVIPAPSSGLGAEADPSATYEQSIK